MNAADFLEMPADTATDSAESFLNSEKPAAAPKPAVRNPPLKIQLDPYQQAYLNQVIQSNGTGQMLDPSRAGEGDFARALYHDLPADIGTRLDEAGNTAAAVVRANLDLLGGTIGGLTPSQSEEMAAQEIQADPLARKVLAKAGVNLPPTESPYEESRQSMPTVPRAVAGAGMGLIQSVPRLALAAMQPELGAASFGATPEGFDPVQAGVMLIAPAGGKIAGNILKKAADAAGVSSKTVLNAVDRAGGAASVAGLMSAPSVYQITQMPDGKEKQNAIENTAANAIIIGLLGATGHRGGENNEQIQATGKQAGAPQGGQQPGGAGGVYRGQEIRQGGNGQESGGIPNEPPSATPPAPRPPSAGEAHGAQPNVITGEQLNMPAGAIPPQVPTRNIPFKGIPDELLQEKPNKPVVPETPAEEYETAVQTVRRTQSKTIKQIQNLFPLAELSREQARVLRDQAWPQPESEQNASGIPSAKSIPQHEVRPPVGEATSLRQQGEVAGTRPPIEAQGGVEPPPAVAAPAQKPNVITSEPVKPPAAANAPAAPVASSTPPLYKGERLVEIQRPDGSTYAASFADKFYELKGGTKIPSVGRVFNGRWSHGMLEPGEKIVEMPKAQAEVQSEPGFAERAAQVEQSDHPELPPNTIQQIVQDEIKADPKGYKKEIDSESEELPNKISSGHPFNQKEVKDFLSKHGYDSGDSTMLLSSAKVGGEGAFEHEDGSIAARVIKNKNGKTFSVEVYPKPHGAKVSPKVENQAAIPQPNEPSRPSEIKGMGGAVPSEFENSASGPTGIRNAAVDQERIARGLPPAMEAGRRSFPDVWDKVMSDFDKDPSATYQKQQDLIKEIQRKPRSLSDYEDAMLLHRQIELQNDYGRLTRELAQAFSDSKEFPNRLADAEELKLRVARLSDELLELYNVNKSAGTETGRGLAARKMLVYENYTLANMEMRLRAAMGGKTLTPEQSAEVLRLNQKIDGLQKQIAEYEKTNAAKAAGKEFSPYVIELAEKIVSSLDTAADAARKRIAAKSGRLSAGIDPTLIADYAIVGASHIGHLGLDFIKWSDAMIKEFGEGVKPALKDIYKESQKVADQVADSLGAKKTPAVKKLIREGGKLAAAKTRYQNRIDELNRRMAEGDFTKPQRNKVILDKAGQKLKDAYERTKLEFDRMVMKEQLKNRTNLQKVQDTFVKWRRAFLLSSPVTLAKLTSAAIERMAITPAEEAVGAVASKLPVVGKVAKAAPREGGFSVKAEARALTEGMINGMKDSADTLKTGHSQLESLFGKRNVMPFELVDFIGAIHGALKAPVKRSEFERSFQKRVEHAIRNGVDPTDPMVQTQIAASAFKDAQRAIFMQDNRVTAAYNAALAILKSKGTPGARALATTMQTVFPIVKVPTNIIGETFQYATGLVTGSTRLAFAMKKGIEKLQPDEADLIMRELKKGSLGSAFMLMGFFAPEAIGGYYQPNDKKSTKHPKFGTIKLFGFNVPTYLIHNPLLETLQIGATIRHVADSKLRKNDPDQQGIAAGALSAALGLIEEVPFVREPVELAKIFNPYERQKYMNEFARDLIVPLGVSWVAKYFDKDENGNYIQRDPQTFWQELESALPYLRKNVPVKRH